MDYPYGVDDVMPSKRFGSKRVLGCTCAYNFTCGKCLRWPLPVIAKAEGK